ncbi:acetylase [Caballeronia turbans]|uniref:acyltransferase family protein n=1 Tax=Caballeronia sp. INSB1 TaxID=2921751 RepID=UPI00074C65CC|nr:acyltransferase [Caballeronia sp. INSB1]SAL25745.1 acetylase [Caballeronia turbans]
MGIGSDDGTQVQHCQRTSHAGIIESKRETTGIDYAPALDGMRAVAVLLVMFGHFDIPVVGRPGGTGVDIFFTLSGYLITRVLLRQFESGRSFMSFYWSRLMRLLPALLVVNVSLFMFVGSGLDMQDVALNAIAALAYIADWLRAFPLSFSPGIMAHTWSLAIEEQFYLLWPAVLLVLWRIGIDKGRILAIALAAASWVATITVAQMGASHVHLYNALYMRLPGLLIGASLAMLSPCKVTSRHAAAAAAIFLICAFYGWRWWSMIVTWLCTAIIIAHVVSNAERGVVRRVLEWHPMVSVGVVSYSLYLWHFPILVLLSKTYQSGFIRCVIGIPVSIAMAYITRVAIEMPALRARQLVTEDAQKWLGMFAWSGTIASMAGGLVFFFSGYYRALP